MRITPNITSQNALYNINKSRKLLDSLTEKIASEQNVNRPSDDPVAARLLTGIADKLRKNEQFATNITKANIWTSMTDTALTGMSETMASVKELVGTLTGSVSDETTRANAVTQLTALREQLADMGNTQVDGQYVFSGTDTTTQPFSRSVQSSPFSTTYYNGNSSTNSIEIDTGATEKLNIPGDEVLTGPDVNILKSIDELIDTLENDPTNLTAINARATELELGAKQVEKAQITNATKINRLDSMNTMLTNTKNSLLNIVSSVQTADLTTLGVELQSQLTAFEATLSATAKITQMSLLDYL